MTGAPFDRAAVLENLGGNEALLAEIGGLFAAEWPNSLARLRAALTAGDAEALRCAAHFVKGSVSNFSAHRAIAAARDLEYAARDSKLGDAPRLLANTIAAVEELLAALPSEPTP